MGLVETAVEHASFKSVALLIVGGVVLQYAISRFNEHRRLMALGKYGYSLRSYVPFGLDLVYHAVQSTLKHSNLEHWRDDIFAVARRNTVEARILNQRIVFTADEENIKAILATQFSDYGKGENFHEEWKAFLGDSIFTTDGAMWHSSRQLLRPQFTRERVSDLHCFETHMQTLFRCVDNGGPLNGENQKVVQGSGNGKVLDMCDLYFRLSLDVTTDFLLGQDTKSMSTPYNEFAEAFNEVQRIQNILARTAKAGFLVPKKTYWKGLDTINKFIDPYIERALRLTPEELESRSKGESGYTFLHALASFTREPKVLHDQIMAVLLAGRDTTASTLSWATYELSRHPHAVDKLRNEIMDTIGPTALPTYDHLKNMPYLRAVLNETLRLYPVVPFNVRLAAKDTTLPRGGGKDGSEPLAVLRETPIAYSTLVMHRRDDMYPPTSETFPEPALWSPERWNGWHPKPHDYIPFNSGPRICIGQQFALTEMSYVLTRMFQRYGRVTNHMTDGGKPVLKADIVLSPGEPVNVAFYEGKEG